jgi:hypothetical protein
MRWAEHEARMGQVSSAYRILVGKSEGKRPLEVQIADERIILGWILETWWEVVDWIHLAQDMDQWRALMNTVMNLRVS